MRNMLESENYTFHMAQMKNVKPAIDNKAPKTHLHCHLRTARIRTEQERLKKLEMENRVLVSRIALIKNDKGGLDNWNDYKPKPSLNSGQRNREQAKICLENQAILKRIKATKSVYDQERFLRDYRVTREYVARIRKNP